MTGLHGSLGRILLVDHSRGALAYQETILRRRDAIVSTALAGSEGLQKAREERPQLIIFGYDLFDMSGPEFCRAVRGEETTKSVSLLLVSDRDKPDHADLCFAAGCNDVIYRPLQRHELDAKVEKLTAIPVRRQLRTITRIEVSLQKNGRFVLGRSLNISATGMLIEVDRVLTNEGVLRINFYLPGDPVPLHADVEILRAEFSGTMARYGLRFLNLGPQEKEKIEHFVNRIRSRELI